MNPDATETERLISPELHSPCVFTAMCHVPSFIILQQCRDPEIFHVQRQRALTVLDVYPEARFTGGTKKIPDKDNNGEKEREKKASLTQVPQAGCYAICQCRSVFL